MLSRQEGNKGEKPFYSTMPRCLYTTHRLFNWNDTLYFDRDIEQSPQLWEFIITFVLTDGSSHWAERENNKSKATEASLAQWTFPLCQLLLIIELVSSGDDVQVLLHTGKMDMWLQREMHTPATTITLWLAMTELLSCIVGNVGFLERRIHGIRQCLFSKAPNNVTWFANEKY